MGVLAQHHHLTINAAASDPLILRNWIRIGGINALLALLLISVVEFVVRSVEANGRAANEALKWLRTAYDKLETTKEDERRFLSHELHDELGQTLTALKLSLQLAERSELPPERQRAGAPLAQPLGLVDDLIARVRRISLDLRPPLLDEVGLVSALRAYLQSQATVSGLAIELFAAEPAVSIARRTRDRLLPRRSGVDHQRPPPRRGPPDRRPRRSVGHPRVAVDPG